GGARSVPVPYLSGKPLPIPPVVPVVPTLDLVRGGARPPEKPPFARSRHAPPALRPLGGEKPTPEQCRKGGGLFADLGNRGRLPEEPLERRPQGEQHRGWFAVGADQRPAFAGVEAEAKRSGAGEPSLEKIADQGVPGQPIIHLGSRAIHHQTHIEFPRRTRAASHHAHFDRAPPLTDSHDPPGLNSKPPGAAKLGDRLRVFRR